MNCMAFNMVFDVMQSFHWHKKKTFFYTALKKVQETLWCAICLQQHIQTLKANSSLCPCLFWKWAWLFPAYSVLRKYRKQFAVTTLQCNQFLLQPKFKIFKLHSQEILQWTLFLTFYAAGAQKHIFTYRYTPPTLQLPESKPDDTHSSLHALPPPSVHQWAVKSADHR